MTAPAVRWGYAINQWKPQFDDFVRREHHERALKTIAIAGFTGVELRSGSGRWEPLGNPLQIAANFGSLTGLGSFVRDCALDTVSSWFWDPFERSTEHLDHGLSPLDAERRTAFVDRARWYAEALVELGGDVLVVRPAPDASAGPLDDAALAALADGWNAAAAAVSASGATLALHPDFVSALRRPGALARVLELTDPELVGLAVDTGELTVAGLDAVAFVREHGARVRHVQLRDALAVDTDEEYLAEAAHWTVRVRGGRRDVPRWFAEPGVAEGLVDTVGVVTALREQAYAGWVVVETDPSPHPATSALLSGYHVQRALAPLLAADPAPA